MDRSSRHPNNVIQPRDRITKINHVGGGPHKLVQQIEELTIVMSRHARPARRYGVPPSAFAAPRPVRREDGALGPLGDGPCVVAGYPVVRVTSTPERQTAGADDQAAWQARG